VILSDLRLEEKIDFLGTFLSSGNRDLFQLCLRCNLVVETNAPQVFLEVFVSGHTLHGGAPYRNSRFVGVLNSVCQHCYGVE
jgi:hypothetical protein